MNTAYCSNSFRADSGKAAAIVLRTKSLVLATVMAISHGRKPL
ncbi:MAG: hypothetical protein ABFD91_18640 [Anaerohalosphaeraceae bacterium]